MKTEQLTDSQLAGQRLMVGFDGTVMDKRLEYLIDTVKVGGIVLFSRNADTPEQVEKLCGACQRHAAACGQPPLIVAIDQEGGVVARLKPPFTQFPGNPQMKSLSDAEDFARITAAELSGVHINMNLAPVLDVASEGDDSVMLKRSFGKDPDWVSAMGLQVIKGLQERKIMAVAKHFPGIGRTVLDSHKDLPDLHASTRELELSDLLPFKAAIDNDVAGIMMSHIRYSALDPKWPASLSIKIAKDLLREKLGFSGVVMTDDLDMGAIGRHFNLKMVLDRVIDAQIDLALICHEGPDIQDAFDHMIEKIRASENWRENFRTSARRVLALKEKYLK